MLSGITTPFCCLVAHGNALLCRDVPLPAGLEKSTVFAFWRRRFRVSAYQDEQETELATCPRAWLEDFADRGCQCLMLSQRHDPANPEVVAAYEVRHNCHWLIAAHFPDAVEFYAYAEQPSKPPSGFRLTRVAIRPEETPPIPPRPLDVSKAALRAALSDFRALQRRMQRRKGATFFDPGLAALDSASDTLESGSGFAHPIDTREILPAALYPATCRQLLLSCCLSRMPGGYGSDMFRHADEAADAESARLSSRLHSEQRHSFRDATNHLVLAQAPGTSAP